MDIHGYPDIPSGWDIPSLDIPSNFHPIIHPLLIPLPALKKSRLSCSRSLPFPRRPLSLIGRSHLIDWLAEEDADWPPLLWEGDAGLRCRPKSSVAIQIHPGRRPRPARPPGHRLRLQVEGLLACLRHGGPEEGTGAAERGGKAGTGGVFHPDLQYIFEFPLKTGDRREDPLLQRLQVSPLPPPRCPRLLSLRADRVLTGC